MIAASLPPVTITSAQPVWMSLRASPIALAAEAHAVATAEHGPFNPQRIESWPLAALTISLGITNGLIRDGPFCIITVCWISNSLSPPMPEPIITPHCSSGIVEKSIPASSTAEMAAARANCANRSRCRASLTPNRATGSQSRTWPPKWTLNSVVSNRVSGPTPLRPAHRADQNGSRRSPSDVTTPMPVITTRRGCAMILLIVKTPSWVMNSDRASFLPGFGQKPSRVTWGAHAARCNQWPGRPSGFSRPPRRGW